MASRNTTDGRSRGACTHPKAWQGLCMLCGARVSSQRVQESSGVSLTQESADQARHAADKKLLAARKLCLVLDMDETLIHTQPVPVRDAQGRPLHQHEFDFGDGETHYVFVRPHLSRFLRNLSAEYDLRLYTSGTRPYADVVLGFIDPDKTVFRGSKAVITRDENPQQFTTQRELGATGLPSKVISGEPAERVLVTHKKIMPSFGSPACVVVVDDREDVWDSDRANLLCIFPFHPGKSWVPNSGDEHLLWMEEKLHKVHKEFYARVDAGAPADVRQVIEDLRGHLLEGAVLAFSRVYPHGSSLERDYVWQSARWCGASCRSTLAPDVTHLVTTSDTTNKAQSARRNPRVRVVKLDWFVEVTQKWNRCDGCSAQDGSEGPPPAKRARTDKDGTPPAEAAPGSTSTDDDEEDFLRMCDELAEDEDGDESGRKEQEDKRKSHD